MQFIAWALIAAFAAFSASSAIAKSSVEDSIRAHIAVLASDEYEGRAPGTAGEEKTVNYIAQQWAKAGLKPAAKDGSWFDPVPLVERGPGNAKYIFKSHDRKLRFAANDIILIGGETNYHYENLQVVFGGYGIKADGSAIDGVAGKAVLILSDRPESFKKELRSASARQDLLAKAGAEAVILVADSDGGNWSATRRRLYSRPIALKSREIRAPLEGAISSEFAVGLVTAAGKDWDRLLLLAKEPGFSLVDLGINADLDVSSYVHRFVSNNVIGKISGRKKNSGAVLFLGHWDHLGICRPDSDVDKICNGAVDNASGIAVLTEIARSLALKSHDRDIYFLATTGEESGLLGAYEFADNPTVPLEEIIIALNIDTIAVGPKGAKVAIIGQDNSRIETIIQATAKKLGRNVVSSDDANAFIQRQDGWALTQKNIPSFMISGSFADMELLQKFLVSDYHGPDDELNETVELGGAVEDTALHIALGSIFASLRKFKAK